MNTDPGLLIHGYLDDTLTDEQLQELSDWIGQDPESARRFAAVALLNDRLHDRFRNASTLKLALPDIAAVRPWTRPIRWGRRVFIFASAAALVVATVFVLQLASGRRTVAAETELDRLIAVSRQAVDRSYRILSLNLIEQRDLGFDFFEHGSHHAPDRIVNQEPSTHLS